MLKLPTHSGFHDLFLISDKCSFYLVRIRKHIKERLKEVLYLHENPLNAATA
jgi:hypothetical protein